jgi:hypothetical protein
LPRKLLKALQTALMLPGSFIIALLAQSLDLLDI